MTKKHWCILVDILLFVSVVVVMITPFLIPPFLDTENFPGRGMTPFTTLMRNMHEISGYAIGVLIVLHMILTWQWIRNTAKHLSKVRGLVKFQYTLIWLLFAAMAVAIISGTIWIVRGGPPTPMLLLTHQISAWSAIMIVGLHVGLHLSKFLSFFNKKKGCHTDPIQQQAASPLPESP